MKIEFFFSTQASFSRPPSAVAYAQRELLSPSSTHNQEQEVYETRYIICFFHDFNETINAEDHYFPNAFILASDQVIRKTVKLSTFRSTPRMAGKSTKEVAAAAEDRRMKIMGRNRGRAVGRKYAVQASI